MGRRRQVALRFALATGWRRLVRASVLSACLGCASAEPGSLEVPVETIELVTLPAPGASSAKVSDRPALERAEPSASAASSAEGLAAPPPMFQPIPGLLGPQGLVTSSSAGPASQAELATLERLLAAAAARDAPGMLLDGGTVAGRFVQADILERSLMLQPGRCYAVVGVSRGGISELDVAMIASFAAPMPSMPPMLLAADADHGPSATLGRAPSCFRNPLPMAMPILVRVTAKAGSGTAAFRVLSK